MLTFLNEHIQECAMRGAPAEFRIKRFNYRLTDKSDAISKSIKKANRYFEYFHSIGLLKKFRVTGRSIQQELIRGSNYFLEIESGTRSFFMRMTSTENSLRRAISAGFHNGSNGDISTVTGMCLFGSGSDWALTDCGEKISVVEIGGSRDLEPESTAAQIVDFSIEPGMSLYEIEKAKRKAAMINSSKDSMQGRHVNTFLATPRVQYYIYLMALYESGRIAPEVFAKWIEAVAERETLVQRTFRGFLDSELLVLPSPLGFVESYIRDRSFGGLRVSFNEILAKLSKSSDVWKITMSALPPQGWKDLINLSYVVQWATCMQSTNRSGSQLIHMDDGVESVILSETGRIKRKCDAPWGPLIGLYTLQDIVDNDSSQDSDLYRVPRDQAQADAMALRLGQSFVARRDPQWMSA